ncbi:MAG: helix-turn-helix transcriptional regulator [Phycisphaeraceae bacterium]
MFDDRWIEERLESPLYASLVQVVELMSTSVQADLAGGRLTGLPPDEPNAYVSTAGLAADAATRMSLQQWPIMRGSIFDALHRRARPDEPGVFRPREMLDEPAHSGSPLFQCVRQLCRVIDSVGMRRDLTHRVGVLLIVFRCDRSLPFRRGHVDRLERLQPIIDASLARGYRLRSERDGPSLPGPGVLPTTLEEMLARLSATEREVLRYLREERTEASVAACMHRSRHTVHVHVKSIYRKLSVNSRSELIERLELAEQAQFQCDEVDPEYCA